jgi:UDP-N-acetylglucosamine 2-epimerase (non-hydrolysing)
MEEGSVMMVGLNPARVFQGLDILLANFTEGADNRKTPMDYQADNVSDKMVRIVLSYTDYVNRVVWSKQTLTA